MREGNIGLRLGRGPRCPRGRSCSDEGRAGRWGKAPLFDCGSLCRAPFILSLGSVLELGNSRKERLVRPYMALKNSDL